VTCYERAPTTSGWLIPVVSTRRPERTTAGTRSGSNQRVHIIPEQMPLDIHTSFIMRSLGLVG
jgi:hypothetical protein